MNIDTLDALSPLDGRYRKKVGALASVFSERGLMARRTQVETRYLLALSEHPDVPLRELTGPERNFLRSLNRVSLKDAGIIKRIELKGYRGRPRTNHDVKAVEFHLRYHFATKSLRDVVEWIHFALTSEDVNNVAYALQLREGIERHLLPALESVHAMIQGLARDYAFISMLARTHGQPASPTTFGKEMRVFAVRENRELTELRAFRILVKLNGASGNYHAHKTALPCVDWLKFSEEFLRGFNGRRHTVWF
ncbi:MAG: lyase family protein, partial [Patescibacteria group bacterium]